MKRRDAIRSLAALAALTPWTTPTWAAPEDPKSPDDMTLPELVKSIGPMLDSIPVQAKPLAPGLMLVTGPGGNITALDGPEGLILVDSFVPGHESALLAAVGNPQGKKPITVINTHWHFDHAGGNAGLGQAGAKIMAHTNTRTRLGSPQEMVDMATQIPASPPVALPTVTFDDKATVYLNGETVQLTHVPPAHTDTDILIHYTRANVLQTGDLFFNGFYPNIDRSSRGWIGGMIAAADILLGLVDSKTTIVPGHGPVGTKADLQAFRSMLAEARDRIEPLVEAGKTVEQAIAAKPLAKLDETWAKGLFKGSHFTLLVFNGLVMHRQETAKKG